MPGFRRRIADLPERASGNIIVPEYEAYRAPERVHPRRFFAHFGVDCVFDVGANQGQYAELPRARIGFAGRFPRLIDMDRVLFRRDALPG